ncbi:MAG TPA: trypsin-like peptidase domain-containing protein [Gemmatimonadales bacterium]|jgi:serine protease Do|nr:trypsin-like peptidase domain-containing protein [Gemmatimonadales bacterium]
MIAPELLPSAPGLTADLGALAHQLRQITVKVKTHGVGDGSGVIWSEAGLIVSNAHVAQSESLSIELSDGRSFAGRLLRRDPESDLALLTIATGELTPAVLGEPASLRPGELVFALGHPFGMSNVLSLGAVYDRIKSRSEREWIRADIRLAPGNSGGPLANAAGAVIGLNTLVAGGLAYAIPVTAICRFLQQRGKRAA